MVCLNLRKPSFHFLHETSKRTIHRLVIFGQRVTIRICSPWDHYSISLDLGQDKEHTSPHEFLWRNGTKEFWKVEFLFIHWNKLCGQRLSYNIMYIFDCDLKSFSESWYYIQVFLGVCVCVCLSYFNFKNLFDYLLLFLDFEKTFDSVEWDFLFKTLERFNFGINFIKWIKILYKNPIFRLENNGWISRTCQMHGEIRKGCPLWSIR